MNNASMTATDVSSEKPRKPGDIALAWWRDLTHEKRGDPGSLARLRRARTSLDALNVHAGAALARKLDTLRTDRPDERTHSALDLARVLAHVKVHDGTAHPMRTAGFRFFPGAHGEPGSDRPTLSEPRFRRLIETAEGEERVASFTRLVALLDRSVNVRALADDFLLWNHPDLGDRVRERWAVQYYNAMSPVSTNPTEDTTA